MLHNNFEFIKPLVPQIQLVIHMRYLILLFTLFPSTLLAQEGMVEYSIKYKMEFPSIDVIMANLPPGIQLDSTMIEQAMQQFSEIPEDFSVPLHMEFSEYKSSMTPDYSSLTPGMDLSQLGMNLPLTLTYTDHMEGTVILKMPSFDEEVYLVSQKIEAIDWVLVDTDSTILDYPVKKATFSSDTLNVVAWYSPEIPSMAGPMHFGGFPGLPLLIKAGYEGLHGFSNSFDIVALRLEEGLEKPVTLPEGTLVTMEEFIEIASKLF